MAAVTKLGSLFDTNSGTHTVTATPAVGDLIVIVVCNDGSVASVAPTDNNADGLGAYTLAESRLSRSSADILEIYIRNALVGSATSTIFTDAPGTTTGGGLCVLKVTGMTKAGASAKLRSGGQDNISNGATPAPAWTGGGTPKGANPLIGAIASGGVMTPPATFDTERDDLSHLSPTRALEVVSDNIGNVSSTETWGSVVSGVSASVILELDAYPAVGTATETDSATAITHSKSRAVGTASEADTASTFTHSKSRAVGTASETDTATAITAGRKYVLVTAFEVDSAVAFGHNKGRTLGVAFETDSASAIGHKKRRDLVAAAEVDTAVAFVVVRPPREGILTYAALFVPDVGDSGERDGRILWAELRVSLAGDLFPKPPRFPGGPVDRWHREDIHTW